MAVYEIEFTHVLRINVRDDAKVDSPFVEQLKNQLSSDSIFDKGKVIEDNVLVKSIKRLK